MDKETNQVKILKTLLGSPKTTGEIAINLGYIDNNVYGNYKIIGGDLKKLKSKDYIHTIPTFKKSHGKPPITYDIVYEIRAIRTIFKEYPLLRTDLQKCDKILSMLINEHFSVFEEKIKQTPTDRAKEKLKTSFKEKLAMSLCFFELCLNNTPYQLKRKIDDVFDRTFEGQLRKRFAYFRHKSVVHQSPEKALEFIRSIHLHKIFEICVFHDILNNEAFTEAIEYILSANRQIVQLYEDEDRFLMENYIKNPEFLTQSYIFKYGHKFLFSEEWIGHEDFTQHF